MCLQILPPLLRLRKIAQQSDCQSNNNDNNLIVFEVTINLQGCLVSRQIKAYRAGYPTYQYFWSKMNCQIFSRLLSVSVWIVNLMLQVKSNFVFCLFNLFLSFQTQSAKKCVCVLPYSITVKKLWNVFEKVVEKCAVFVEKSLSLKNTFWSKKFADFFMLFMC